MLIKDDESDVSEDEENCLPAIDELTNTINNLDINPKKLSNLVFKPNYLVNMNNTPTTLVERKFFFIQILYSHNY